MLQALGLGFRVEGKVLGAYAEDLGFEERAFMAALLSGLVSTMESRTCEGLPWELFEQTPEVPRRILGLELNCRMYLERFMVWSLGFRLGVQVGLLSSLCNILETIKGLCRIRESCIGVQEGRLRSSNVSYECS